jgi:hypothetical protein
MSIVAYLAERVPWAVVGLLAGYLLGRGIRILERIDAADSPEESIVDQRSRGARFRKITGNHILGVVVFLLAVGTVVQGYIVNEQTKRQAVCTQAYANGFADAIDARSVATAAAQQALDDLMAQVGQLSAGAASPESRERFRAALVDYLTKRAEDKKQRKENPFPAPPRDVCK